jgi:hypothetical protein
VGEGFTCTSTSAAKRLAQPRKNAAKDKTILRMSAYATPCPHFRKVNLAQGIGNRLAMRNLVGASLLLFPFFGRLSQFD